MERITFNDLPTAIENLTRKVDLLLSRTQEKQTGDPDKLMNLSELIEYLPEHPAKQTCYGWINSRFIPYEKHGKRLYFRKSIIDQWLSNGRQL